MHLIAFWIAPLLLTSPASTVALGICDRTPQVRTRLVVVTSTDVCRNVTPRHLARVKKLSVSGRQIASLQAHDFSGLVSLEELYLSDNNLTDLPEGIFQELNKLKQLSLAGNSLTSLPQGIFEGLTRLEVLWLGGNPLTSLPERIFKEVGTLKQLFLGGNSLTSLPQGIFEGLTLLEVLWLGPNPLARLPEGIFDGLDNLKYLDLSRNALTVMPEGLFGGLNRLETLNLAENRLIRLPEGIFKGLGALKILFLDGNQLSSLPGRVFNGLSGLYNLRLNKNSLRQLPATVFHGLEKLGELHLDNNVLTSLPAGIFDDVLDTLGNETYWPGLTPWTLNYCLFCGGLVVDDNLKATIAFTPTSQLAVEGQSVRVTVTLNRPLPVAVRVPYFVGGNAIVKHDYTIPSPEPDEGGGTGGLLFLAGETSKDIVLTLIEDADRDAETILFSVAYVYPLFRSDGTGEQNHELESDSLVYRSDLNNRHVVTIVSGSLPPALAPKDSSHFTDWAVGKRLTWYDEEVFFRDAIRFRYEYDYGGNFTGRSSSTGSYSYRREGPHVGTVALSYDGGRYDELQITFVSETTGMILHKSLLFEEDLVEFSLELQESPAFVPVILKSAGRNRSFYTSELTLTNRWSEQARLNYNYTAHVGGGSGTASEVLAPGQQLVVPDAIAYLKKLGIPIPDSGNRLGTLRVDVSGVADVGVVVRTTTPVPDGRAGLAYPGVAPRDGFYGYDTVYLLGLRRNIQDRSNVALQHMGMSEYPVTLRTTVYSADPGDDRHTVLDDVILKPGEFHQYNDILASPGYENGYVTVQSVGPRESFDTRFHMYGVINDNFNSDGSFVLPTIVPRNPVYFDGRMEDSATVIVETGSFTSELTVTNLGYSDGDNTVNFSFVSDQIRTVDHRAEFSLTLEKGEQRIVSNIVDELRRQGIDGIGPHGRDHFGVLFIDPTQEGHRVVISVRTGSPDGHGGQYGVSYNAVKLRSAFRDSAWIYGLQQNAENRSNLALINTGRDDDSEIVFEIDIYDGITGMLTSTVREVRVAPRRWHQIDRILARHAPGTTQGYAQIRTVSGKNSFLAYAVINDGGAPGQRSGDGAYLAAQD